MLSLKGFVSFLMMLLNFRFRVNRAWVEKIAMLAPANSTHFSWSFQLDTFIMVNVLDALDEILQEDY